MKYSLLTLLVVLGLAAGPIGLAYALISADWRGLIGVVVCFVTCKGLTS